MKKLIFLLLIFCICLTGCSKQEKLEEPTNANATFDAVEYETIEKMNEAIGSNIVSAAVAGKTDESFIVISNSIAQYKVKVNDEEWCIRASKDVDNDISGLYYDSIDFKKDTTAVYYTDEVDLLRFFDNGFQYTVSLNVKDKDISTSHFDDISNEFKTNITGVKSGYESDLYEDGDDVIYSVLIYNDDGSVMDMKTIYSFENDVMVKISSIITFETEEALNEYLDELVEYGNSIEEIEVDGKSIISDSSSNVDFYSDMNKEEFITMMKNSLGQ